MKILKVLSFQNTFEKLSQKLIATVSIMSVMMSASMDWLCPKNVIYCVIYWINDRWRTNFIGQGDEAREWKKEWASLLNKFLNPKRVYQMSNS